MPVYKYKSVDSTGKTVEKIHNALDKAQMMEIIRSRGEIPIYVEEYTAKRDLSFDFFSQKVKIRDIAVFCRQFYTMLYTGIPIITCLSTLKEQTENKKMKQSIESLYEDVQTGLSLSDSIRKTSKVFPDLFVSMVEAGEISGNLDAIMLRMAVHYDKESKLNSKIKNAMIYPVVLLCMIVLAVIAMLVFILPMFVDMFISSGVEIPLPTRVLIAISDSMLQYWYAYIVGCVGLAYIAHKFSHSEVGREYLDRIKLKLPVIGKVNVKVITSRFARTLSTLMFSGISVTQALEITSKVVNNRVVERVLIGTRDQVRQGVELSVPIKESGIFAPMLNSMIMVGEETGMLDDTLEKASDFYDDEVEFAMQTLVSLLEPMMILIMAMVIAFVVISIYLPMFDMMQAVG